ncbi:MAG: response regulator transcription factor [Dehalococcoidales bacterium]|nr:response regulator transcription factor [Dehalococcoidales bacterium]
MSKSKATILVVDDEASIIRYVKAILSEHDYKVLSAIDGSAALEVAERELPDLVILDIMMPKINGFEVCRRIREWSQVPVIMLSANADEADKVKCLNLGADDYVTKPFGSHELVARVKAVLRRTETAPSVPTQPSFTSGSLEVNFAQRRVTVGGEEVKLTPTEYNLLQELVLNAGKVLTHTHLLNKVWGPEYREEREYLHVFIRRLRSKLESGPAGPKHIVTVSGVGYQFKGTT